MESKDSGFGVHRKIPERKFECFEVGQKLIYEGDEAEVIRKSPLLVIKAKNRIICGAIEKKFSMHGLV